MAAVEYVRSVFQHCLSPSYRLEVCSPDGSSLLRIHILRGTEEVAAAEALYELPRVEIYWVQSAMKGHDLGSFLLGIHLWLAARQGATEITLQNMTDNLGRAARGIYRLFRLDRRFLHKGVKLPPSYVSYATRSNCVEGQMVVRVGSQFRRKLFYDYFLVLYHRRPITDCDIGSSDSPWCAAWDIRRLYADVTEE